MIGVSARAYPRCTAGPFRTSLTILRALIPIAIAVAASAAHAWGSEGHQVVANLAQAKLTANAKAEIDRLLAVEPGATLASISTWADEHRDPTTTAWHYVNFPNNSCNYEALRACPDGNCVVEAINKQLDVLASRAPAEQRLTALKYVVHLVADVHQPLHAGYAEDRGGNRYQLQAFGDGTNLHALWDSGLIHNLDQNPATITARMMAVPVKASDIKVAEIAEESCRIVGTPGFYPDRKLGPEYIKRFTPVMEQRLAIAGARLAATLNRVFR